MNNGTLIEIITHYGHDSGEFKYFAEIGGNKFIDLDLRDDFKKNIIDNNLIDTKLKNLFIQHKL